MPHLPSLRTRGLGMSPRCHRQCSPVAEGCAVQFLAVSSGRRPESAQRLRTAQKLQD